MLRALTHFWRLNLAILAGAAVATAVLAGALVVGDSVRGSLRQLTLERLGGIDHALAAQRFVGEDLADRLSATPAFADGFELAAPAILLRGSAVHAGTRARASDVGLQGIDERFLRLYAAGEDAPASTPGAVVRDALFPSDPGPAIFPPAVINESLAAELGAAVGDDVILSLESWSAVPRGSLLGRKDTGSVVERVRCRVAAIVADQGLGAFGLAVHQTAPHNLFMPLAALQKALDQKGTVNAIAVHAGTGTAGADAAAASAHLDEALRTVLEVADLGLTVEERDGVVSVESEELILKPAVARSVDEVAVDLSAESLPILTYLANQIRVGELSVPYSTVSAIDAPALVFGELRLIDGSPAPQLTGDEILLNRWTAEELEAEPGDEVELTYFVVGPREELREETHRFRLRGIVELAELGADRHLAQEYPGIADVDNMADWDPPFPIELERIRPSDEEYWDLYRSTPRAFVALAKGRELWRNRWGDLTSIRLAPPKMAPETLTAALRQRWLSEDDLGAYGLAFQPVKARGLQAARGATDFAGLFIGFSQFLIVSAALLAGLLFSLAVEQRASEIGLRLALGYPPRKVRRLLLGEGAILAVGGALIGCAGAVAFAGLMMAGLRTWWREAVGTSRLFLHVEPVTLIAGFVLSVLVILLAIWRAVRRVGKVSASRLLARVTEPPETRPGRKARLTAVVASGLAVVLLLYAVIAGKTTDPILFFALGPCLLIAALALLALRFGGGVGGGLSGGGPWALWRMALSNCGRNRGRSLLSAALVAVASFMIVAVAAFHQDFSAEASHKDGGTGGFALVAEADVELHQPFGKPAGRDELGLSPELSTALEACSVVPLRLLPGDDTSCLNLYQPSRPRLLGVPPELVDRQAFTFQAATTEVAHPWTLLDQELEDGVIPAIGDINSTQWILKLKLGEELPIEDEHGETVRLRLVGALATSLFQSELLISEANFRRHFPSHSGFSYFLIDAPSSSATDVARLLENELEPYGFDAQPAVEKLASFHAVQNTYLSTFQSLGGLGLLLGTVGLAVILARNVLERRGELATLRAFGFRASTLTHMVVAENVLLLLAGLVIGGLTALVAVWPGLAARPEQVAWTSLGGSLAAIFLFGLAACVITALAVLRAPLLPALKAE